MIVEIFLKTVPKSRVSDGGFAPPVGGRPFCLLAPLQLLGPLPRRFAGWSRAGICLDIVWKSQSQFRGPWDRDTEAQKSWHDDSLHITALVLNNKGLWKSLPKDFLCQCQMWTSFYKQQPPRQVLLVHVCFKTDCGDCLATAPSQSWQNWPNF